MTCEQVRPLLYRFADDRLLRSDADIVSEHVANCSACAQRYRKIGELDEWVVDVEDEPPPGRLRDTLLTLYRERMTGKHPERGLFRFRMKSLRRVAAVIVVAFVSSTMTWVAVRPGDAPRPVPGKSALQPVELGDVFPIVIAAPYFVLHKDGHTESGARIQIIE